MKMLRGEQVKKKFAAQGQSITGWAKKRGFNVQQVFEVLAGRNLGIRGNAHRIAIALKMKRRHVKDRNARAVDGVKVGTRKAAALKAIASTPVLSGRDLVICG